MSEYERAKARFDAMTRDDQLAWLATIPLRYTAFQLCRFCGVTAGQAHKITCTWHWVGNPLPAEADLFGTDADWDARAIGSRMYRPGELDD